MVRSLKCLREFEVPAWAPWCLCRRRYSYVDSDLTVVSNTSVPGLSPLNLYVFDNGTTVHHITTASPQGNAFAQASGFKLVGVQGYVYLTPATTTAVPLEMHVAVLAPLAEL